MPEDKLTKEEKKEEKISDKIAKATTKAERVSLKTKVIKEKTRLGKYTYNG